MLIKGIETAARAVTANGRPLTKIKPGCKKNIQPEKAVQVIIVINDQPGTCLPNMKKSTGVIIFFWFLNPIYKHKNQNKAKKKN